MARPFAVVVINEMVDYLERLVRAGVVCSVRKELIFNRVRELQADGYADDVALSIALREYRVIVGPWRLDNPADVLDYTK